MQVRRLEKSRHHLVATMLAESIVEESMQDGFERTALTIPDEIEVVPVTMETDFKSPTGEWSVIPVVYSVTKSVIAIGEKDDKLKKVEVSVTWTDSAGGGKITLITYLAGVF